MNRPFKEILCDRQTGHAVAISVNNDKKITDAMLLGAKLMGALRQ